MKYDIIETLKDVHHPAYNYKVSNKIDCGNDNWLYEIDEWYTNLDGESVERTLYIFTGENGYDVYDRVRGLNKDGNSNNGVDLHNYKINYYIWYHQNGESDVWLSYIKNLY